MSLIIGISDASRERLPIHDHSVVIGDRGIIPGESRPSESTFGRRGGIARIYVEGHGRTLVTIVFDDHLVFAPLHEIEPVGIGGIIDVGEGKVEATTVDAAVQGGNGALDLACVQIAVLVGTSLINHVPINVDVDERRNRSLKMRIGIRVAMRDPFGEARFLSGGGDGVRGKGVMGRTVRPRRCYV